MDDNSEEKFLSAIPEEHPVVDDVKFYVTLKPSVATLLEYDYLSSAVGAAASGASVDGVLEDGLVKVEKPQQQRLQWDNKLQFVLSLISYAVGLGNIWRFPYLCQRNGGGAFLIPYTISLVLLGIPLFYLELGIGQKLRTGSIGVWNTIHPYLGGVGISSAVVSFLLGLYYNVIIAWCVFYLVQSFQFPLPWQSCPVDKNGTKVLECEKSSETSYFWYNEAVQTSDSITELGGLNWKMTLSLVACWIVVFLCQMKGIKSAGKVMMFTAVFPYIVLTIFFVRAMMLDGAVLGLTHMLTPNIMVLKDPRVWLDAATQIFFSFGLAFGGLIAFSSYSNEKNDCRRDTLIVSLTNWTTSLYAAIVIFAILGFKANDSHKKCLKRQIETLTGLFPGIFNASEVSIEEFQQWDLKSKFGNLPLNETLENCNITEELNQAAGGTGLAFITFTQAMLEFPGAPFWAVIFFLMLLSLGLGSMIGTLEGVVTSVNDLHLFRRARKEVVTGILCIVSLSVGFLFVTKAGVYWLELFDNFTGTFALMAVALLEVLSVTYVYGWKKFCEDLRFMTGHYPSRYWQYMWRFVAPLVMVSMFVSSIIMNFMDAPKYTTYNREKAITEKKVLPTSCQIVAVLIVAITVLPMPAVFILRFVQKNWVKKYFPVRKETELKLILEKSIPDLTVTKSPRTGTDSGLGSLEDRLARDDSALSFG